MKKIKYVIDFIIMTFTCPLGLGPLISLFITGWLTNLPISSESSKFLITYVVINIVMIIIFFWYRDNYDELF